ncbi:MAG: hypothetical protein WDO71_15555 [Bacteroidota bacterium]
MNPGQYWMEVLISNIIAIIILLSCIYRPRIGRILFALLFVWAAFTNWSTSHSHPEFYLEYRKFALFDWYKDIINGFFARHIEGFVSIVAISQLLTGISMLLKGWLFRVGCIGGIIFLLSIAPLGVGSGFPCTIIMAAGLVLLLKKYNNSFVWQNLKSA